MWIRHERIVRKDTGARSPRLMGFRCGAQWANVRWTARLQVKKISEPIL